MYLSGIHSSQKSRLYAKPDEPTITQVVAIDTGTVRLSVTQPSSTYNPVLSYSVESFPSIPLSVTKIDGDFLIKGDFQLGANYTFKVSATNTYGTTKSSESITTAPTPYLPLLGSSSLNPALSGQDLVNKRSGLASGLYWIKSASMPSPLRMYVDTTQEGGGYDFYPITGGTAVNYVTDNNSGKALGLDIFYPRSSAHWTAIYNYINSQLGGDFASYLQVPGSVYKTFSGGNYTGSIMRSGSVGDWRVPDGGRWWLRDSTFSEPNGDYTGYGYLGLYGASYVLNSGGPSGFNDGGAYGTGTSYIVSTNGKP